MDERVRGFNCCLNEEERKCRKLTYDRKRIGSVLEIYMRILNEEKEEVGFR